MTIAELREVLNALPAKLDGLDVVVLAGYPSALCHVDTLTLDKRKPNRAHWDRHAESPPRRRWDDPAPEPDQELHLNRKLWLAAERRRLWYRPPPPWELAGPWPEGLALVGLDHPQ